MHCLHIHTIQGIIVGSSQGLLPVGCVFGEDDEGNANMKLMMCNVNIARRPGPFSGPYHDEDTQICNQPPRDPYNGPDKVTTTAATLRREALLFQWK